MRNVVWAPLEIAINQVLILDPAAATRLAPLEGKTLAVELRGLPLVAYFLFTRERINVLGEFLGEPDAHIVGTPLSLARIALTDASPQALFGQDIELRGDIDVARRIKAVLDALNIDWEEQLAWVMGDVVAHQVSHAMRDALGWSKAALSTLGQDITEYLHEESNMLPDEVAVRAFMTDVDRLRSDADRLSLRVQRVAAALRAADKPADAGATTTP